MTIDALPHLAIVVNSIVPGGGVSNVAMAQAKELSRYFSISLLCAHGSLSHDNIQVESVIEPKLTWLRRFGHVVREYVLCIRFSRRLEKINQTVPIDFVLFHSHTAATRFKSRNKNSVPCGMVIHGDIFSRPRGTYDPLLTQYYRSSSKSAYRMIELTIALSPSMRLKAIGYGADSSKVKVIPNGVDARNMTPVTKVRTNVDEIVVVFVGRLTIEKAPLIMLQALTKVETGILLRIAGSGPLEPKIREFIISENLADRVELLGHLSVTEVKDLYFRSDILCVPSIDDPLPTVILEAMMAGIPVIGSEVDGIPFMIEHDVSGILVPPSDPNLLAKAIVRLANDNGLRLKIAKRAQIRVQEKFSLSAVTSQLVTNIKDTILKNQRS